LAGFYRPPIKLSLEESIAEINIEDEDTTITGRIDILAVNKEQKIIANVFFLVWQLKVKIAMPMH
jgi:hypothetical protein